MKRGDWVLLDEMNLASQSVLEGLNACLDHRGEAYIPELDRSFRSHPDFLVFAAQNPQHQGGGRKGLPKSFVNRFSVVYVDMLTEVDLKMIARHLYPQLDHSVSDKLVDFVSLLEKEVVLHRKWGAVGGPWEFNLRDTLRWLSLMSSPSLLESPAPAGVWSQSSNCAVLSDDTGLRAMPGGACAAQQTEPVSRRRQAEPAAVQFHGIGDAAAMRQKAVAADPCRPLERGQDRAGAVCGRRRRHATVRVLDEQRYRQHGHSGWLRAGRPVT
ncbi:hypothetical protein KL945_003750 [Ogataea haglerorum]|nr:hypothetical protein KL945_003750 [Ogataea haglerorum]